MNERRTILIAEDDDGHALLLQRSMEDAGLVNDVLRFTDGKDVWDFLSRKSTPCFDPDKKYVLVLDVRMHDMDGIEVLKRVKAVPRLKDTPVIMLTTTDDPADKVLCEGLGCYKYLTKPEGFDEVAELVKRNSWPHA